MHHGGRRGAALAATGVRLLIVVDAVVKHFEAAKAKGEKVAGQAIRDLVTVNGKEWEIVKLTTRE